MTLKYLFFIHCSAASLVFCASSFAGDTTKTGIIPSDSINSFVHPIKDSNSVQAAVDTSAIKIPVPPDSSLAQNVLQDSTATALKGSNLKLIKRSYNSRQQVILATGMMIFVVLIMTLAQQFNPG